MTKHSDLYIACKRLQLVLIWEGFNYTATSLAPGRPDSLSKDNRNSLLRDKQQTADMSGAHFQIQTFKAIYKFFGTKSTLHLLIYSIFFYDRHLN